MNAVRPTVDEVIGTLKRSSDPTLLAEGVDDIAMLRRFEDEFNEEGLSIFPLGGRTAVLEIFERREELPPGNVVLFLVDKDIWVYTGVPERLVHSSLLFTDGYSIENDLYRDGNLERLLTAGERVNFTSNLQSFLEWYALSLARKLKGEDVSISTHPQAVLQNPVLGNLDAQVIPDEATPDFDFVELRGNYTKLLRGKSLMALLVMQLSASSRPVKHSVRSLMEHGVVAGGDFVERIRNWIADHLRINASQN